MEHLVRHIENRLYETQQELYNTPSIYFWKVNGLIKERKKLKDELKKLNRVNANLKYSAK